MITKLIHYGLCMIASPKLDNPEEAPTNEIWVHNEKWCAFTQCSHAQPGPVVIQFLSSVGGELLEQSAYHS